MNENLNLVEILKDCPEGTKLYSPVYGDVELVKVIQVEDEILSSIEDDIYPIKIKLNNNSLDNFTKDGLIFADYNGECMLFPSKDQRDWSKFKPTKPKFVPKFKVGDMIRHKETNKDDVYEIMKDVEDKKVKVFYDDRKCCEEDDRDPNFLPEQYHVKKEPSRPFHNAEEGFNEMMKHQPFGWVYDKNNNQFLNTNRVGNDGVDFYGRQRNTFAKANSYITFADKEPFGIKE